MAYATEMSRSCQTEWCMKLATHKVYAYGNQPHGVYCKKHADERVRALNEAEAKNPGGFA